MGDFGPPSLKWRERMVLKLSLPEDRFVWALSHPTSREYIHQHNAAGYQECNLIISQENVQPVEVNLDDYPKWAQMMIRTSIRSGLLLNSGDSLDEVKLEKQEDIKVTTVTEIPKKTTKKRQTRRKKKVE